ncbi:hypothetical protein [Aliihoeflea sp. 40Bstr573]|uniref:hypothetical protein n=1 Tax=Aliihoeflea sp. 40Bstr573 TaxID=2696467 RepID=UPI002095D424|nr:hypothetical protein [Aliihoeflea sp. 40Bstr573]MCO6386250.1 hypothetical protein [Aliihoeflea sp. 40Bstr573]
MPTYSFYTTGTAGVSNGGVDVNFQNAGSLAGVRVGDLFGSHVGLGIPIAAIPGPAAVTLAYPWPGPSQANGPYSIMHTPYDAGLPQQLQKIIDRLTSGNVSAFADLVGAEGLLPYFTGAGQMAVADGPAVRGLIGLDDLGVGSSAVFITNANDAALGSFTRWEGTDGQAAAANLPQLSGGDSTPRCWTIITTGGPARVTQIVSEVYRLGIATQHTFQRSKHDATWKSYVPLGGVNVVRYQQFAASGAYVPHPGMLFAIFEAVGGGGGGGCGSDNTLDLTIGSGGGSGSYGRSVRLRSQLNASTAITIGGGGAGGTAGVNGDGSNGGTTGVDGVLSCPGGLGGGIATGAGTTSPGGHGGASGSADYVEAGSSGTGGNTVVGNTGSITRVNSGKGADSWFGAGGRHNIGSPGEPGRGYGAGGGPGGVFQSSATINGGAGRAGFVLVTEFCAF